MKRRAFLAFSAGTLVSIVAIAAWAQPSPRPINGVWNSNYGQVVLNVDGSGAVSGQWTGEKGVGRITGGQYDGFAVVVFSYYQPWNGAKGQASLRLSGDGQSMSGGWSEVLPDGRSASAKPGEEWTLTR